MFWITDWIYGQWERLFRSEEEDPWSTFSTALYLLVPVSGLILLWTRKDFLARILLQMDKNCISIFCPSLSKREKLLKWAADRLPANWSSHLKTLSGGIVEFWTDGSLLCTLVNTAVPGACPNPHRHWRKPPIHGQSIAYKYLGVVPSFTENDLNGAKLSLIQERRFINYLYDVYLAMSSIQSLKDQTSLKVSNGYVARGMGLYAGERHKAAVFYIYQHKKRKESNTIRIMVRGPYRTLGSKSLIYPTAPRIYVTSHKSVEKRHNSIFKPFGNFLGKAAPLNDIPITVDFEDNRLRVTYTPNNFGMFELCITADDEQVSNSPYNIHIVDNNDRSNIFKQQALHAIKESKPKPKKLNKVPDTTIVLKQPVVKIIDTDSNDNIIVTEPKKVEEIPADEALLSFQTGKNYFMQIENNNKLKPAPEAEDKCTKTVLEMINKTNTDAPAVCERHTVAEAFKTKRAPLRKQPMVDFIEESSPFSDAENYNEFHSGAKLELASVKSLPNIPAHVRENKEFYVRSKAFWENMSGCGSGSVSTLNLSDCSLGSQKSQLKGLYKSSDNILLNDYVHFQNIKPYKSIDASLDYCTIFSIEERKQFLLKDSYVNEKHKKNNSNVVSQKGVGGIEASSNFIRNNLDKDVHFKKSIRYFQNLEKQSNSLESHESLINVYS